MKTELDHVIADAITTMFADQGSATPEEVAEYLWATHSDVLERHGRVLMRYGLLAALEVDITAIHIREREEARRAQRRQHVVSLVPRWNGGDC